ncbi:MAG: hypothetical protein DMD68_04160 [Gemmatimonadetes bacterium]|nr:MAG: hypothetical protein DMD68_04160 [Gemmatimonadota bacterium]
MKPRLGQGTRPYRTPDCAEPPLQGTGNGSGFFDRSARFLDPCCSSSLVRLDREVRVSVRLYAHLSWTTFARLPLIKPATADFLRRFSLAEAKRHDARVIAMGVVQDHVHLVLQLPAASRCAGLRVTTCDLWASSRCGAQFNTCESRSCGTRNGYGYPRPCPPWAEAPGLQECGVGVIEVAVILLRRAWRARRRVLSRQPRAPPRKMILADIAKQTMKTSANASTCAFETRSVTHLAYLILPSTAPRVFRVRNRTTFETCRVCTTASSRTYAPTTTRKSSGTSRIRTVSNQENMSTEEERPS